MENMEVKFMASELVSDYGKEIAIDSCYESINKIDDESEIVFWEKVLRYIDENYDDDVSFMM